MTNMNTNAVLTEPVTMLLVCILIDGKEIIPHVLQNEDVTKGVLMSWTHVEPRSVQAFNETTFLATYLLDILADKMGKPVVMICDEVATTQLPQVIEHVWHTMGVESVVFNTRVDNM